MKRCGAVSPACLRYEVTLAILSPRCIQQCLCITRVVGDAMSPFTIPLLGPLAWIDMVLLVWFALTLLSVGYVAWDAFTNNPEMVVMKWGWVLVTLYLGPVSLFLMGTVRALGKGGHSLEAERACLRELPDGAMPSAYAGHSAAGRA